MAKVEARVATLSALWKWKIWLTRKRAEKEQKGSTELDDENKLSAQKGVEGNKDNAAAPDVGNTEEPLFQCRKEWYKKTHVMGSKSGPLEKRSTDKL